MAASGLTIEERDEDGSLPKDLAAEHNSGNPQIVALLNLVAALQHGGAKDEDILPVITPEAAKEKDEHGMLPLHYAVHHSMSEEVVKSMPRHTKASEGGSGSHCGTGANGACD